MTSLLKTVLTRLHDSAKGPVGRAIHRLRRDIFVLLASLPLFGVLAIALSHAVGYALPVVWAKLLTIVSVLLVVCSGLVIALANPVHSLLSLISVFILTSITLLQKGQEYFAFLYLLIGIGAVATLFLFVIMLLPTARLTQSY